MSEILWSKVRDAAASISTIETFWTGTADGLAVLGIMDTESLSG